MTSEVSKDDLNRIYDAIGPMQRDIAEIKTTLKLMPGPPARPCDFHVQLRKEFDGHLGEHLDTQRGVKQAVIRAAVDIIKLAIGTGVGVLIGLRI